MTGLILKDFLVMRKTIKTYALLLLFYVIMTVLDLFSISFTTAILEVIVMMLPMSAFSYDEMAKWDRYAMTLPLGRRAVAVSYTHLRPPGRAPRPRSLPIRPGRMPR